MIAIEAGLLVTAVLACACVVIATVITRGDLRRLQQTEDRVDEQLHAMHEAMLLWNYGDRTEAINLLAEHDIFVSGAGCG